MYDYSSCFLSGSLQYQQALQEGHVLVQPHTTATTVAVDMMKVLLQSQRQTLSQIATTYKHNSSDNNNINENNTSNNNNTNDNNGNIGDTRHAAMQAIANTQFALKEFSQTFPQHATLSTTTASTTKRPSSSDGESDRVVDWAAASDDIKQTLEQSRKARAYWENYGTK